MKSDDMNVPFTIPDGILGSLDLVKARQADPILHLSLNRPNKRNAINDELIDQLRIAFANVPNATKVVIISGEGAHFCAGLDLSELVDRDVLAAALHSRGWHSCFDAIQYGKVPVIAVLQGAVIGGGLELASSCHLRVAEPSAYFGLPEGQRGIFVGGGGSVRVPRLMGTSRMADMMLTGRVFDAQDGERHGVVNYLVEEGQGLQKAIELAHRMAGNSPMTAFAVMHALPRIVEQGPFEGLFTESLMSAVAASTPEAKERLQAFLAGKAAKVLKPS